MNIALTASFLGRHGTRATLVTPAVRGRASLYLTINAER
jgi:hypothetical protein